MTFPTQTVRFIAKDLAKKDILVKENTLLYERASFLENKVKKLDITVIKKQDIIKSDSIFKLESKFQLSKKDELNNALEKDIKKEKRTSLFYKITTGAATVLAIFIAAK
jgi:hypothetical protein